jgi:RHS repeat-associated protein
VSGGVPVQDVQYQYDLVGNRQVVRDNGVPVTYTVNNMNQYTTVGGEPLSYDANGNLTSMPGLSLQYDSWNRLISAATESNLVLFAYDGRHRCVKRVEIQNGIGRTTIMIWGHEPSEGWGLLEERGPNGELLARHVHGPSVDDLVLSELNGAVYYYHQDHLNSTIALTDASGAVVEQYRYDVYGQPFFYGSDGTPRNGSALGIRFLFTGREWFASLAIYDYRHRAYSPSLGRFLPMDPLGFAAGDVSLYRYSLNSAIMLRDPTGEDSLRSDGQNVLVRVRVPDPCPWPPPPDISSLRRVFDSAIAEMEKAGRRFPGRGWASALWNNIDWFWKNRYLCTDQALYLIRKIDAIKSKLTEQWEAIEVFHGRVVPYHVSVLISQSSNPEIPFVEADPHKGTWRLRWPYELWYIRGGGNK